MPNDHGPTYVDVEGIKWRRDGSVWNCWVAEQWVPAPSANPTGLVKVDAEAAIPTCGRCGEEVLVDGSFCGSCGANLRVWQDETPEETLAVPEQETVVAGPRHFPGLAPDPFALLPSPPARTAGQERQPHETSRQASDGKWYPKWARTDTPPPPVAVVTRPAEAQKGIPRNVVITLVVALVLVVGGGIVAVRSSGSGNPNQATAGIPCSENPACSGGSTGSGGSTSSGPSSSQLSQAYDAGYRYGQNVSSVFNCRSSHYSDPQLSAQYQSGCGAGFSTVSQCASMRMSDPIAASDCRSAARRSG